MHEKGSDKGFVGNQDSFLLLTPIGTNKGFEIVDSGCGTSDDSISMWGKKSKRVSKVIPSMRCLLLMGSRNQFRVT